MLVDICHHPIETIRVIGPLCRLHDVFPWSTTRMRTCRPLTSLADLRRPRRVVARIAAARISPDVSPHAFSWTTLSRPSASRVGDDTAIRDLEVYGILIPRSEK